MLSSSFSSCVCLYKHVIDLNFKLFFYHGEKDKQNQTKRYYPVIQLPIRISFKFNSMLCYWFSNSIPFRDFTNYQPVPFFNNKHFLCPFCNSIKRISNQSISFCSTRLRISHDYCIKSLNRINKLLNC